MKLDKHTLSLPLTRRQRYFAGCWYNMVHQHSLDSHRVPVMNPLNMLPEMRRIYRLGKADERASVRAEAHRILAQDLVLREPPFAASAGRLLRLTEDKGLLAQSKEEGRGLTLLEYFIAELAVILEEGYVDSALKLAAEMLAKPDPDPSTTENLDSEFAELHALLGSLLSALIYKRASLESLYSLFSEVLVPRAPKPGYAFHKRMQLLAALLTQPPHVHHIVLALDNVTQPDSFPSSIGGVQFGITPPYSGDPADKSLNGKRVVRYLDSAKRRLFASLEIEAQDPRAAGAEAADKVNDILNLVRFEYERERVTMPVSFAFLVPSKPTRRARVYSLPAVVPNPSTPMDVDGLSAFVRSVDELVLRGRFSAEGRDRVNSAFRLYRTGLDSEQLDNKLVNWWTALEYLVRGSSQVGGIGKSVEDLLTPVLCRSYLAKHLIAYRSALMEIGAKPSEPDGSSIELKGLAMRELLVLLRRRDIQVQLIAATAGHEFFTWHLSKFFEAICDAKKLYERNVAHEQKLRWHLQRLWRARCDIVHSAERSASAALMCANLEYYLKSVLMALLKSLRDSPTLSGPKEFFDRQALAYEGLQDDLKKGSDRELMAELAA